MKNQNEKEILRKQRITDLRNELIEKLKKDKIDLHSFTNLYCFKHMVSKRTFREYLDIAMTLAGAKINHGSIESK
jgi:hypothetical protein